MTRERTKYAHSFPGYLADDVETVGNYLKLNRYDPDRLKLKVDGEQIEIPYRIYIEPSQQE